MFVQEEEKVVAGFIPNSLNEWIGKISCIVFLPGCNWSCAYCYNHALKSEFGWSDILQRISQMKYLDGVVFTGGEATLHAGLPTFISDVKKVGLKVKLSTNGSNPDVVEKLLGENMLDCLSLDYKAPFNYLVQTVGAKEEDVQKVQKSFLLAKSSGIEREYHTTLCPSLINDFRFTKMAAELERDGLWVLQQYETKAPRLNPLSAGEKRFTENELQKYNRIALQFHDKVLLRKGTP